MRLIDADKILEQLDDDINITSEFAKKSIKYDDYRDFDKSFAILYMLKSYRAIVEDMKTAFDVDKVISNIWDRSELIHIKHNCYDEVEDYIRVTDVSEIVKAGGINDN